MRRSFQKLAASHNRGNSAATVRSTRISNHHFVSKLSQVPKEHTIKALTPPPFSLHPPFKAPPAATSSLLSIDTLRFYLKSRNWPSFPSQAQENRGVAGGNPIPHLLPIWEALVSSVLTYPLTILKSLHPYHLHTTLATAASTRESTQSYIITSKVLVIGARKETTLPSYYWLETWYGVYFHAYNARKREEKLMHDKAVRRVHIEMHKYNKAKKMNPQARLPTEWMHRANETTTDLALARKRRGKPRRPNPAAMRLPERTIYVDLSLDFVGPEVAGLPTERVEVFGNPRNRQIFNSMSANPVSKVVHVGCLNMTRSRDFYSTKTGAPLANYGLVFLPNPGIGHPHLREGWAETLSDLGEYYGEVDGRYDEIVLTSSYNCPVDGTRDFHMLRSYFLPHKFDVIDTGPNEFADRRTMEDQFADEEDGIGAKTVSSNYGLITVRKREKDVHGSR